MLIAARSYQDFACCRHRKRTLEIGFRFCRVRLLRHQRNFPSHSVDFGLVHRFLGSFDARHRVRRHPRGADRRGHVACVIADHYLRQRGQIGDNPVWRLPPPAR